MSTSSREPRSPPRQPRQPTSVVYLTLAEVGRNLHLSRSTVYDLIAHEGLPTRRFGRAVRVPLVALQEWLGHRADERTSALPVSWTAPHGSRARTARRRP